MAAELDVVHLTDRRQLADWFAAHHDTSPGIWLVSWRSGVPGPRLDYEEIVEECLRYGWIDSTARVLDEHRGAIRVTPRRAGSVWARTNKGRVARLEAAGLMLPPGRRAVERAQQDGSWTLLDDVENLVVPPDLAAALAAAGAADGFAALSETQRKAALWWVKSAKRDTTRSTRIEQIVAAATEGRSALP